RNARRSGRVAGGVAPVSYASFTPAGSDDKASPSDIDWGCRARRRCRQHHATKTTIASSHNPRLANAATRQKSSAPVAGAATVTAGAATLLFAATPASGGVETLAALATAPVTRNVCAGTLACSARPLSTFHQFKVIAGIVRLPFRCGTIAKLRVRLPCSHWSLSSVESCVWSG